MASPSQGGHSSRDSTVRACNRKGHDVSPLGARSEIRHALQGYLWLLGVQLVVSEYTSRHSTTSRLLGTAYHGGMEGSEGAERAHGELQMYLSTPQA